jgi:hypothetical protein
MERAARVIAKLRQSGVSRDELVRAAWPVAVGLRLANRTRAVEFYASTLVVEVNDDVWRSNLGSLRDQITNNLARVLGDRIVVHLDFRIRVPRLGPQQESQLCRADAVVDRDDADGITDPVFRIVYRNARKKAQSA